MSAQKCGTCRHWLAGQCYRYPPALVLWPNDNQHPIMYTPVESRPSVGAEEPACGEWKKDPMRDSDGDSINQAKKSSIKRALSGGYWP